MATIQIRNVPDKVHQKVKARAAKKGISLSAYLKEEIERLAAKRTWEDFEALRLKLKPSRLDVDEMTAWIRQERDERGGN